MLPGRLIYLSLFTILFLASSCRDQASPIPKTDEKAFHTYWYQGKAEISSFQLNQSRYGANHDGKTVMVFVTEDFSQSKHVKLDEPLKHKTDAVKVMKLNMNKEFVTGIYRYSMMSSVFTPVDYSTFEHSFKLTAGSQDWSGQSFMQAAWKGNRYEVQHFSYFESEGDSKYSLTNAILEDEIWTRIRIAPHTLPIGKVKMIASAFYIRLSHKENKVYNAETSLVTRGDHYTYVIQYPELIRKLEIDFAKTFPFKILSWKETYGNNEVTSGQLLNTVLSDYWMHNHPEDEILRNDLDLTY